MAHNHAHHHHAHGDQNLAIAIAINLLLTVAEIVGGVLSGSLSLIADALHNLSDAGSLIVALAARRIAGRPADEIHTFGYGRAEVVGALINLTTLVVVGLYLILEGVTRLISPEPVGGWIMVGVSAVALVIDAATALLTWRMSKESLNIRAAFVHNVADALGSVAVIIAGALIILYGWNIADAIATFLIAGYVLYHGLTMSRDAIRSLMDGVPADLDLAAITESIGEIAGVGGVHHVHIRQLGERETALEAHIDLPPTETIQAMDEIKQRIKEHLKDRFKIGHVTLEFECDNTICNDDAHCVSHPTH